MQPLQRQAIIRECIKFPWYARTLAYDLAARVNAKDQCRPSQATLARENDLSRSTVQRAIATLQDMGALAVDYGIRRRATYTLTLDRIQGASGIRETPKWHQGDATHRSDTQKWDPTTQHLKNPTPILPTWPALLDQPCTVCKTAPPVLDGECESCISRRSRKRRTGIDNLPAL